MSNSNLFGEFDPVEKIYPSGTYLTYPEGVVLVEDIARDKSSKEISFVKKVMEITGWSWETALRKMEHSLAISGASYQHYWIYHFWELTDAQQVTYFTKGDSVAFNREYNQYNSFKKTCVNKDMFLETFKSYTGRSSVATPGLTFDTFISVFGNENKIIYKPRALSGGQGVQVFEYTANTVNDVYRQIISFPFGVVEQYIIQHPDMQQFSRRSVNTIRVVTIRTPVGSKNVEKDKLHFLYGFLRMGVGDNVVDNLHCGGIAAAADMNTGILLTDGVDFQHNVYETHPDTGVRIKGARLPMFAAARELMERASSELGLYGYLGWDIAVTTKGPVVVEINTLPGADGLQTPYLPQKEGKRYVVEPFFPATLKRSARVFDCKIASVDVNGITVSWNSKNRCSGFEVYRLNAYNGNYELIAIIESPNIKSFPDSSFDHSQPSVSYCVRSFFRNRNGVRSYSDFTAPITAYPYEELSLAPKQLFLFSGSSRTVQSYIGWGKCEGSLWSSSDETVALVDAGGKVNAVSSGSAVITCTAPGGQTASLHLMVDREPPLPLKKVRSRYVRNKNNAVWENTATETHDEAVILMVGDINCDSSQIISQKDDANGWDFSSSFRFFREVSRNCDFVIGHLNVLTAAPWPYSDEEPVIDGTPNKNAPSCFLEAIRYGGFDALTMASDVNCLGGKDALNETMRQVDNYKFAKTGTFYNASLRRYFIADINGIKTAFLSYVSPSVGFNGKDLDWSPKARRVWLNEYSQEKIVRDIAACRQEGAEFVIVYMYWGNYTADRPTALQKSEANIIAQSGADYIVGTHPGSILPYTLLRRTDGCAVPCFYSVGPFLSTLNQSFGRDSVAPMIRLRREADGTVRLVSNTCVAFHTFPHSLKHLWPVIAVGNKYNLKNKTVSRIKIFKDIKNRIGEDIELI